MGPAPWWEGIFDSMHLESFAMPMQFWLICIAVLCGAMLLVYVAVSYRNNRIVTYRNNRIVTAPMAALPGGVDHED